MHSLENLSAFSFVCGLNENGEKQLNRVIDLRTKVQGEKHPDTLACIASKVAHILHAGRVPEAEQLGLECVKMCKENLKPEDLATLRATSNLASVYATKGDFGNVEKLCREVLEIRRRTLPYDAIDTLKSMVNLSGIYMGQKRWADSSVLLEYVISVRRRTLGDGHALTIQIARQLEYAYEKLRRWKDVQPVQLLILEATRKSLGNEHDETLDVMTTLLFTYVSSEAWSEATKMIQEILRIRKKKHPPGYPKVLDMESCLETIMSKISSQKCPESADASLIYSPLRPEKHEIRLVYIKKSAPGAALHARLLPVSLHDAPPYEALSYVWGDKQNHEFLTVAGHHLDITTNLEAALLQLRSESQDRLLWVDAI